MRVNTNTNFQKKNLNPTTTLSQKNGGKTSNMTPVEIPPIFEPAPLRIFQFWPYKKKKNWKDFELIATSQKKT